MTIEREQVTWATGAKVSDRCILTIPSVLCLNRAPVWQESKPAKVGVVVLRAADRQLCRACWMLIH